MALILLILAFSIGNVYKLNFISPEIHVSFLDITVAVLALVNFRAYLNIKSSPLFRPIAVFTSFALLSLIVSGFHYGFHAQIVGLMYLVRWIVYSTFFLTAVKLNLPKNTLLILGLITAILGLVQYFLVPDVRGLAVIEWDLHYYRLVGTLLDPGFTGLILVFTLIFITVSNFKFKYLFWAVTYLALALTYSRSSYLAFLAGMSYIAIKRRSAKFIAGILILFAVTIYLLPRSSSGEGVKLERTNSINTRVMNWLHALTIFKDHPILGVGFNTYRYAQNEYGFETGTKWLVSHAGAGSDSSLLFIAATTGLLGLAAYLWYSRQIWILGKSNLVLSTSYLALMIHSLFLNSLFYPAVMLWITLLVKENTSQKSLS